MLLPDLPHDVDALVMQLLEKDPSRRPPDGFVLQKQLDRIRAKLDRKQAADFEPPTAPGALLTMQSQPTLPAAKLDGPALPPGEGPATMASRVVREELENLNRGGPVRRFFNHPLTLVVMFAACVGLIAWGLTRKRPSAEELYAAAAPLMASDDPADWRRAWDEYLERLTSRYPDHPHREEVAAFQRRVQDVDRLDKAVRQADAGVPQSEAERFYRQGLQYAQNGDAGAARRVWQGVVKSFAGVASERRWVDLANRGMARLGEPAGGDQFASAREALAEARKLRDAGQRDAAARIWDGLVELYHDDPAAAAVLAELWRARGR
jgi:hypothetical protein